MSQFTDRLRFVKAAQGLIDCPSSASTRTSYLSGTRLQHGLGPVVQPLIKLGSFIGREELVGRAISERTVRACCVVSVHPYMPVLRFGERVKAMRIEQFGASVE